MEYNSKCSTPYDDYHEYQVLDSLGLESNIATFNINASCPNYNDYLYLMMIGVGSTLILGVGVLGYTSHYKLWCFAEHVIEQGIHAEYSV